MRPAGEAGATRRGSKAVHLKDIRTCVREAEALDMSYGQYVAAGLDQVADAIGRDADEQTA